MDVGDRLGKILHPLRQGWSGQRWAFASLLSAVLWTFLRSRSVLIVPPYVSFDGLRNDSFAAVILTVYPVGLLLLCALWFLRLSLWEDAPIRSAWILLPVVLATLAMIAVAFATPLLVGVGIAVVLSLLTKLFGDRIRAWAKSLIRGVIVAGALLGLLWMIIGSEGDAHVLTGVVGISLAAAMAGSLASVWREKGVSERDAEGHVFGQVWSWPYAPFAAALVLQFAAVARTYVTGEPINLGLPGVLLWLSLVVSILGLTVALRFRVYRRPNAGPRSWWHHSVGFRHLSRQEADTRYPPLPSTVDHYMNWLVFGLAFAALAWGAVELWDGWTGGFDRAPTGVLVAGALLSLAAMAIWLGAPEQFRVGEPRIRANTESSILSYRAASAWAGLLTVLGLGIPVVSVLADKADNRPLGPPAAVTLTVAGHAGLVATCPYAPRELRAYIDRQSLREAMVSLELAPGYCDGDRVEVPSDSIAAVRELDDIDAPSIAQPIDPRAGEHGHIRVTWQMPDRLGSQLNLVRLGDGPDDRTLRPEDLIVPEDIEPENPQNQAELRVVLQAQDPDGPARCADAQYSWRVTNPASERLALPVTVGGCQTEVLLPEGEYDVVAESTRGAVGVAPRSGRARISVQDWLVVALGDSVGSGEGNPPFRDDGSGCNRSDDAGQVVAAQRLERRDPTTSVTLLHLSCTGGRITHGNPTKDTRRQAGYAKSLVGRRQIDAVLLSVSANDLEFAKIVTHCITWDCARDPISGGLFDRAKPRGGTARTVKNLLPDLIAKARQRYIGLAATISTELKPRVVLVTEYFDPSRDEDGEFCSRASAGFVEHEARLAFEEVISPLNRLVRESVKDAAERFPDVSWQYVPGIAADFASHGYCALPSSQRWVVGTSDAPLRQLQAQGAFHPNARGHLAIAAAIYPALAASPALAHPTGR